MPDMIPPVGAQIQTPNPQQSLGMLSGILGIQQQQLGIQTGQANLQAAQATASQAGQQNRELRALSQFTIQAANDPTYKNLDGSLNTQKFQQDAIRVAPVYGQAYIGQATLNANEALRNRSALLALTNQQRETVGNALGAYAADPNANSEGFTSLTDYLRKISSDPGYQSAVNSLLMHAPQVTMLPDAKASQALRTFARNAAVQTGAPSAALSAPATSDYTQPGVNGQPGAIGQRQTNPLSPMGLGAIGPGTPQGLAPTQTPTYAGLVAGATARAGGVAGSDIDKQRQVSALIQPSTAAIPLTNAIDDLTDQIHSGTFAASISKAAAALGMKEDTYARQLLAKDLGQVQAKAEAFAPTDEARRTILSGYPEATSDPQTIHTAMDYVRGSFKQNVARGQNMLAYQRQHPDLAGFQQSDDTLTSKVDPLMTEYRSLTPGAQRQGFLKRNFQSASAAQAFVDKLQ